jgi:hypothetical protein
VIFARLAALVWSAAERSAVPAFNRAAKSRCNTCMSRSLSSDGVRSSSASTSFCPAKDVARNSSAGPTILSIAS